MAHSKKKPASRSILIQILIPMALVMLVQSSLFTVTLLFGGTVEQLRTNAFDILTERVNNRKNYLQNEMIQRWSNMGEAVDSFQTKIQTLLDDADASPEHLTVSSSLSVTVLEKLSEDMILLLRRNGVTGVFVVLEGDGSADKTGLYLRDMDPKSSPADNSDLLVERGPSSLVRRLGFATDIFWQPRFLFDDTGDITDFDFYQKPFQAAKTTAAWRIPISAIGALPSAWTKMMWISLPIPSPCLEKTVCPTVWPVWSSPLIICAP